MGKEKKKVGNLSLEELKIKAGELEEQLFRLRMQKATGQLGSASQVRLTRKELARVKTAQTLKTKTAGAEKR